MSMTPRSKANSPFSLLRGRLLFRRSGHPVPREEKEIARKRARFSAIIEEQQACLLRVARRLCRREEDWAQDLVQDALIRGYQAYVEGRFVEDSNVRAWLVRILTNGFLMDYRHRKKWSADTNVDTLSEDGRTVLPVMQAAPGDTPGTTLFSEILDEPLENALDALPEGLRLCVLLVDIEEFNYAQTAEILEIPIGTVRSRLFRAHRQLQSLLQEYARQKRLVSP